MLTPHPQYWDKEDRLKIHREKDVRDGAARQEETGKAKEEDYGSSEGGHACS